MFRQTDQITEVLNKVLRTKHALVIGDIILDQYIWGIAERISPEAPVPIVKVNQTTYSAGGAANVALNLAGLGLKVSLISCVGNDNKAGILKNILKKESIINTLIPQKKQTTTKTRVMSGHQHLLRLDSENTEPLDKTTQTKLTSLIKEQIKKKPSVVIISDYAKGLLTEDLCQLIIKEALKIGIPVLVDPKGINFNKYKGATALTPNRAELAKACQISADHLDSLIEAGKKLRATLKIDSLFVTLGDQGILYLDKNTVLTSPAAAQNIFDVSGAGDTVIAVLAACIASEINKPDALTLANKAAGIIIGKVGTAPIKKEELLLKLNLKTNNKICDLHSLEDLLKIWKIKGKKIVFTNGCFDILHAGHVAYLEKAKKEGDFLIVGLNSDASVRQLKGPYRPINKEQDRAHVLASLACVDAVVLFNETTPLKLIKKIKPTILVKGGDYANKKVVGKDEVLSRGGRVKLIDFVEGYSSTEILQRMTTKLGPRS